MIFRRHKIKPIVFFVLIFAVAFLLKKSEIATGLQIKFFSSIGFFRAEITESQKTVALLAEIDNLKKENALLKESLAIKSDFRILPAKVLLGGGFLFSDKLFIDVGKNASIKIADKAIDKNNFLIGFVDEVGNNWSRIKLATEIGSRIPLRSGENKEIIFEAEGIGGGEMAAKLPNSVLVKAGDIVWFGANQSYAVGLVDRVKKQDADPFQKLYMISPMPARFLTEIFIVTQK